MFRDPIDWLLLFIEQEYGETFSATLEIIIDTAFIWMPLIFALLAWQAYLNYIRAAFVHDQGKVLLEIKIPREVTKTPQSMEVIFNTLYQKGEPETFIHAFIKGKVSPWFSLELVSDGGNVHMYVWAWRKYKNIIEQQFYAQFPSIEIYEVDDYATPLHHDPETMEMWGCQFKLGAKDVYPIQTYVDYGLDKPQKEEEKTDPLTSVLEYLGGVERGNKVFIQILIRAHRKRGIKDGYIRTRPDWSKEAEKEIEKIRAGVKAEPAGVGDFKMPMNKPLIEGEGDAVKAIKRHQGKHAFECVIRALYVADRNEFNPGNISGLLGSMQQFNAVGSNGIKLSWKTDYDVPWKDFRRSRELKNEKRLINAYKRRSYFEAPYKFFKQRPFILSTEELATLFHIPGSVAMTPTLARVGSRKGEAPGNIPAD